MTAKNFRAQNFGGSRWDRVEEPFKGFRGGLGLRPRKQSFATEIHSAPHCADFGWVRLKVTFASKISRAFGSIGMVWDQNLVATRI